MLVGKNGKPIKWKVMVYSINYSLCFYTVNIPLNSQLSKHKHKSGIVLYTNMYFICIFKGSLYTNMYF